MSHAALQRARNDDDPKLAIIDLVTEQAEIIRFVAFSRQCRWPCRALRVFTRDMGALSAALPARRLACCSDTWWS